MNPITAGRLIAAALVLPVLGFSACAAPPDHDAMMKMPTAAEAEGPAGPSTPDPSDPTGKTFKVKISNFVFDRQAITVPVGSTVTWVNEDDIPHNIVSQDRKMFHSHALDTDQSFSFTFTKAGEFGYFCGLHPMMTGKVIVS